MLDPVTGHTDYSRRPMVLKFWPWWLAKIKSKGYSWEYAIKLLESGKTIKFLTRKDRLGMIQRILQAEGDSEF
jgi:hypothetical protein